MAFKTFTLGEVLTASDVNTYLAKQAVIVCTSGTRPSSPVEGMTIYETDTDKLLIWDGAAWVVVLHAAAWSTWSPTLTNLTLGNGTVTARYHQRGKTVDYRFKFLLGSTSAVGTNPQFTLPVAPAASYAALEDQLGSGTLLDSGTASRAGMARLTSGSTLEILSFSTTGVITTITSTVPHTWATSDTLAVRGTYETT